MKRSQGQNDLLGAFKTVRLRLKTLFSLKFCVHVPGIQLTFAQFYVCVWRLWSCKTLYTNDEAVFKTKLLLIKNNAA